MRVDRRSVVNSIAGLVAGAALGAIWARPARAQAYPEKLIRVVIPFAAGGPNDVVGRPLFEKMAEILGQPFVIENRPGGQGRTATLAVAKSAADGYTLLMTTGSHIANMALYPSLPYDPLADFIPVAQIAESYGLAHAVRKDLPGRTLTDFIEIARQNPGKFTFAHPGVGNANHIAGELFQKICGVQLLAVPYRGSGSYIQDVISGQVDMAWASTALVTPNAKSDLLRALATTGAQRAPSLPDLPTMIELGFKDFDWNSYFGLYAPAGTLRDRISSLNDAVIKGLSTPEMQRILSDSGLKSIGSTPEQFRLYLEKDLVHQRAVASRIGLKLDQ